VWKTILEYNDSGCHHFEEYIDVLQEKERTFPLLFCLFEMGSLNYNTHPMGAGTKENKNVGNLLE